MKKHYIEVPSYLIYKNTLDFINTFKDLREDRRYIFDFKYLETIDTLSLLCLSSEMALFKKINPDSKFSAKNFEHRGYEAHMGFFKSFGLNYGKNPGEANNSLNYIPITLFSRKSIIRESQEQLINPAQALENKAKKISNILTRNDSKELNKVLTYCIREILRNIIEHSNTDSFGFCAQYFPKKNKVSFAVLDRGIGVKNSLSENPNLNIANDLEAIKQSLKPGVSGKVYDGKIKSETTKWIDSESWMNSGFGLYMTSNICKKGGEFFIASNTAGVLINEKTTKEIENLNLTGTGISLTINTKEIDELNVMLIELNKKVSHKVKVKASKSSLNEI
jgi:hypothetical protein